VIDAVGGQRRVGVGHLEGVGLHAAERDRADRGQVGLDAEPVGHGDHVGGAALEGGDELRVHGVDRVHGGAVQVHRAGGAVTRVGGRPQPVGPGALLVGDRDRRWPLPVLAPKREPLLECGRERERLERGPRLAAASLARQRREVEPGLLPVAAADHREHLAGRVVDRHERGVGVRLGVGKLHLDGLLGHALQPEVERGRDLQATPVHAGAAVTLEQLGTRPLHEVLRRRRAGDAGLHLSLARRDATARLRLQPFGLLERDVAVHRHLIERVVAAELVVVLALDRVVEARRVQHRREHRRLAHGELRRRLVEVGLGGGLRAVRAVPEVHRVEVFGEDLVLRELLLDLDREERLADLLLDRARGHDVLLRPVRMLDVLARVDVLDELLGDRGGADDRVALHEVGPGRRDDAGNVDAGVLVEPGVLGGEHGVLEVVGDAVQPDDLAVDRPVQRRELRTVAVEQEARADRRQGLGQIDARVGHVQRTEHRDGDQQGHEHQHPPEPAEGSLPSVAGGVLGNVLRPSGARGGSCRHDSRIVSSGLHRTRRGM